MIREICEAVGLKCDLSHFEDYPIRVMHRQNAKPLTWLECAGLPNWQEPKVKDGMVTFEPKAPMRTINAVVVHSVREVTPGVDPGPGWRVLMTRKGVDPTKVKPVEITDPLIPDEEVATRFALRYLGIHE